MQETMEADALLIGRVTYESFAGAWPERDGPFADKFNTMPKYVVSSTLENPGWTNTTVVGSNAVEAARTVKSRSTG
jgi:dihydrofolate reductase